MLLSMCTDGAMAAGRVGASLYTGRWTDVGTPARLDALNTP